MQISSDPEDLDNIQPERQQADRHAISYITQLQTISSLTLKLSEEGLSVLLFLQLLNQLSHGM